MFAKLLHVSIVQYGKYLPCYLYFAITSRAFPEMFRKNAILENPQNSQENSRHGALLC